MVIFSCKNPKIATHFETTTIDRRMLDPTKKRISHVQGQTRSPNKMVAAAVAKSLQSCPTLCDPIDGSPPGPTVPGILQARTLEWVAISSSNA